jgi:flagellar basal body rod protein FlgG
LSKRYNVLRIESSISSGQNGGEIIFKSEASSSSTTGAGGSVTVGVDPSSSKTGGNINLLSGTSVEDGFSGYITLSSDNGETSGAYTISSGFSKDKSGNIVHMAGGNNLKHPGKILLKSGMTAGSGKGGTITLHAGASRVGDGGKFLMSTGNSQTVKSGKIHVYTSANPYGKDSGTIDISTNYASEDTGDVKLKSWKI